MYVTYAMHALCSVHAPCVIIQCVQGTQRAQCMECMNNTRCMQCTQSVYRIHPYTVLHPCLFICVCVCSCLPGCSATLPNIHFLGPFHCRDVSSLAILKDSCSAFFLSQLVTFFFRFLILLAQEAEPLGSGCMAQVHRGCLHGWNLDWPCSTDTLQSALL